MQSRFPNVLFPSADCPHFIGGRWTASDRTAAPIDVLDAATEEVLWTCHEATPEQIDAACNAAHRAFLAGTWSGASGAARAQVLRAIAAGIKEKHEELARVECHMGKILAETRWDIDDVIACFEFYAGRVRPELAVVRVYRSRALTGDVLEPTPSQAAKLESAAVATTPIELPDQDYTCEVRKEPMGVVAAITPWNYPLLMATWKIAPALAAGCSVVIKPSELSPITTMHLAAICARAGLPAGVLNVLVGGGAVGSLMAKHPVVDKVTFTGSEATGVKVSLAAAPTIKNVALELGGKSAVLVFDDGVDLDRAVEWVMFGAFWTNGQICSATSRLLVQDSLYDAFVQRLVQCARAIPICAPLEPGNEEASGALGPLVAKRQLDRVARLVSEAVNDGAQLLTGGRRPPARARGFFYEATALRVDPERHEIWSTEVFGPVLAVATFASEAEALKLANASSYGLAAAVLSGDEERRKRVAASLQAGIVWVQCSQPAFCNAPWGGFKRSGVGRDLGEHGMDSYLEQKQVTTHVADAPLGWYSMPKTAPMSKL